MIQVVKKRWFKVVTAVTLFSFINQLAFPIVAYALTGGPSQPEVQSFEPVGTTQLVDLSTGDFNYNIPLMDVGGYPINLAYHAGIGMDQEASWVGLGWNINPGVINRDMRGLPDDFSGEVIEKELNIRPNTTVGVSFPWQFEVFGLDVLKKLGLSMGVFYNNYKGVGYNYSVSPQLLETSLTGGILTADLSISANSQEGVNLSPKLGFGLALFNTSKGLNIGMNLGIGTSYNSRQGIKGLNYGLSASASKEVELGDAFAAGDAISRSYGNPFKRDDDESAIEVTAYMDQSRSVSVGGSHSFTANTYTPDLNMNMRTLNVTLSASVGASVFGTHPAFNVSGNFSTQYLKEQKISKKAYGYCFGQNAGSDDVLLDFNREKDGVYNEHRTNLPLVNHTYDVFSVTGQGIGGSYRAYRSDVPILHSDRHNIKSTSSSIGVELGIGGLGHFGLDLNVNFHSTKTGKWDDQNLLSSAFGYVSQTSDPRYEPYYFKSAGEQTAMDQQYWNAIGQDELVGPYISPNGDLSKSLFKPAGIQKLDQLGQPFTSYYYGVGSKTENVRQNRESRNNLLLPISTLEASRFGLDKKIRNYSSTDYTYSQAGGRMNYESYDRTDEHPKHHFSQFTVLNQDGASYIYGIPAYNTSQVDKTFNVATRTTDCVNGQVSYQLGTNADNSVNNQLGNDRFYSSTKTPEYAHSYLLTGYLSPDYVDMTGDGISDDDLGTAVRFNYSRIHKNYRWRVPVDDQKASYSEGLRTDPNDDKGSYSYGTKEIWYMHSIETKTHVAVFILDSRHDGLGVEDENGGADASQDLRRLKEIRLYSKQDYIRNGTSAVPIKTAHFEYNYSLCKGVDNNLNQTLTGKLTLTKVFFTYGNSGKGRLNAYDFKYHYEDANYNPDYNLRGSDWWGTYKPNAASSCGQGSNLGNSDFPYTIQDKTLADKYAASWCLTQIKLPGGGSINIEYESDDYAYVQNRRAMAMFKIKGMGFSDEIGNYNGQIYNKDKEHKTVVYIDLKEAIQGTGANNRFKADYLEGVKNLQFTLFAEFSENKYEFVKGYCEIDPEGPFGVLAGGTVGYFTVKKIKNGDKHPGHKDRKVNPFAVSVWNFARLYCPHLVHKYSPNSSASSKAQMLGLLPLLSDLRYMIQGFNKALEGKEFGRRFNESKSWVRLNVPDKVKYGGGHRVKRLAVSDNWSDMGTKNTNPVTSEYGQEYTYTIKEEQKDGTVKIISSGVAAYEPLLGGDENPLRQPRAIKEHNISIPDDSYYQEEPFGESFYPAPTVVYSKVKVTALQHNDVERTATGFTVTEFYTAKDYPVHVKETYLQPRKVDPHPVWSIFKFNKRTEERVSQGYTIELNDMHGKPKSEFIFPQGADEYDLKSVISGTTFKYKTDEDTTHLNNNVLIVNSEGEIEEGEIAVEVDFAIDSRKSKSATYAAGIEVNTDIIPMLVLPLPVAFSFPSFSGEHIEFRSATTTKVIKKYGLLAETRVYKNGSSLLSKNLLYDKETGQVLLTATQNEFEDFSYAFMQPAYWGHRGMGPAYRNAGMTVHGVTLDGLGNIQMPNGLNTNDFFTAGDEVSVTDKRGFVNYYYVYDGTDGVLNLIDKDGNMITNTNPWFYSNGPLEVKVMRSGYRNLTTAPMASITTLSDPIVTNGSVRELEFNDVLAAGAVEYKDEWQTYIQYMYYQHCDTNPEAHDWIRLMNDVLAFVQPGHDSLKSTSPDELKRVRNTSSTTYHTGTFAEILDCDEFSIRRDSADYLVLNHNNPAQLSVFGVTKQVYPPPFPPINIPMSGYSWFTGSDLQSTINDFILDEFPGAQSKLDTATAGSYYLEIKDSISNEKQWITLAINHYDWHIGCDVSFMIPDRHAIESILEFKSYAQVDDQLYLIARVKYCDGELADVVFPMVSRCFALLDCDYNCYNVLLEEPINPYRANMHGNWRPLRNYAYLDNRNYTTGMDVRNDGTYQSFVPFWDYNVSTSQYDKSTDDKWVWASEVTKYTPFGNEVENRDALDRYSAAIFGYEHTLAKAVAANASYNQIAFDGFEDYGYIHDFYPIYCVVDHWSYRFQFTGTDAELDDQVSHSGFYSLNVHSGQSVTVDRDLEISTQPTGLYALDYQKVVNADDDLGLFQPQAGNYIVSAWVKEERDPNDTTYSDAKIEILLTDQLNNVTTITCKASGNIIEGWQRIEKEFEIPAGTKLITVKLTGAPEVESWFDDIRIFPYDANMRSFAYDARTMRLMAEMDENNYATFYEYDEEGTLVRVKKETVRGVVTLQENRNHYRPTQ